LLQHGRYVLPGQLGALAALEPREAAQRDGDLVDGQRPDQLGGGLDDALPHGARQRPAQPVARAAPGRGVGGPDVPRPGGAGPGGPGSVAHGPGVLRTVALAAALGAIRAGEPLSGFLLREFVTGGRFGAAVDDPAPSGLCRRWAVGALAARALTGADARSDGRARPPGRPGVPDPAGRADGALQQ